MARRITCPFVPFVFNVFWEGDATEPQYL